MDMYFNYLADELSSTAVRLLMSLGNKTIDSDRMFHAFEIMFVNHPEFSGRGVQFAMQALEAYQRSFDEDKKSVEKLKSKRQEARAGLLISVSKTEKLIRRNSNGGIVMSASTKKSLVTNRGSATRNAFDMGKKAPIALAALLEFVVRELMAVVCRLTEEKEKKKPLPRDVLMAIENIEPLKDLGRRLNNPFVLLDVGVVPHLHEVFSGEKTSYRNPKRKVAKDDDDDAEEGEKKAGKKNSKPGEESLRQIRAYQRTSELLTEKTPFEKKVREMLSDKLASSATTIHLGRGSIDLLRSFVEDRTIDLCMTSVDIMATSGGKKGIRNVDLELAWTLKYPTILRRDNNSDTALCKRSRIDRLQFRSGIKRKTCIAEFVQIVHRFMFSLTSKVLDLAIVHLTSSRIGTLNANILLDVFQDLGYNVVVVPPETVRTVKKHVEEEKEEKDETEEEEN